MDQVGKEMQSKINTRRKGTGLYRGRKHWECNPSFSREKRQGR